MIEFIKKLRQRPEHERKTFAFMTSLISTAIIAVVWFSIDFRLAAYHRGQESKSTATDTSLTDLKNTILNQFQASVVSPTQDAFSDLASSTATSSDNSYDSSVNATDTSGTGDISSDTVQPSPNDPNETWVNQFIESQNQQSPQSKPQTQVPLPPLNDGSSSNQSN